MTILAKKIPQRTCVACRAKKDKRALLRIVRTPEGHIEADRSGKKAGRGAYICNDVACLDKVIKTKQLESALETPISDETYAALREIIAHDA